ncbi:MAG: MFS transporter [Anaerolineae bacterium]|nr:MFS transporter [Anaerolineae bacterium]MCA9886866.1 MFS transporter [Anaerolineae bacterium]MCA9895411.1 MFS transporter [Anaerolineae bacterium]
MTAALANPSLQRTTNANFHHLVMDVAWFGLALAASSRFAQFYAIRLGATPIELGWLAALPALVLMFATMMAPWWRRRYNSSVNAVWGPGAAFRLIFLLPAFAPLFPEGLRVPWLIASAAIPAVAQGIASVLFIVAMRESLLPEQLTRNFARRAIWINITVTAGVLGFGFMLEELPFPFNYQVMFVMAFVFSMVSQWHITKLKPIVPEQKPKRQPYDLMKRLRDTKFQSVALITLASYVGFFAIIAVIPLHMEQNLGVTEGFMAIYGVFELVTAAFAASRIDWLVQRLGNRKVAALGMVGTAVSALLFAVAPNMWFTLPAAALSGASWTFAAIAVLGFFSARTEAEDVGAAGVFHQIMFTAMFIGPMLGNGLVSLGLPIAGVLLAGVVIRLLSAVVIDRGLSLFGKQRVEPEKAA